MRTFDPTPSLAQLRCVQEAPDLHGVFEARPLGFLLDFPSFCLKFGLASPCPVRVLSNVVGIDLRASLWQQSGVYILVRDVYIYLEAKCIYE